MNSASGKRAEEYRQCGHESLTLAGSHLGNLALVEYDTANELYIVVYHVPFDFVSTGNPVVLVYRLVALDGDEVATLSCELTVGVGSCDLDGLVGSESGGSLAHCGKHGGEHSVELLLVDVEYIFLALVYLIPQGLALLEGETVDTALYLLDGGCIGLDCLCQLGLDVGYRLAQLIVGELLHLWTERINLVDNRLNLLQVALRLIAKYLIKY